MLVPLVATLATFRGLYLVGGCPRWQEGTMRPDSNPWRCSRSKNLPGDLEWEHLAPRRYKTLIIDLGKTGCSRMKTTD